MAFPEAAGAPRAELWAADALATLDKLVADGRQVDLIHLDPPFGSEAAYDRKVTLSGASLNLTLRAYDDRDGDDLAGYLEGLYNVLCRARDALAPHGSLYLHLDPRRGPYARVLLDEIFGAQNFVNQIIWAYALGGSSRRNFQRKHDVIYLYARDRSQMYFNAPQEAATSSMLAGKGKLATDTWETTGQEDDSALLRDWPDELVRKTMSNRDPERTGYPTQKPLALVNRMVTASCPPGGLVVDPMSGSATLAVAAVLLGRNAIAGDRGAIARDVARARLLKAGASVHVDTLDEHMTVRAWPSHAPVVIRDDAVHLQQFEFPADLSASVVGSAAQDAVREVSRRDGRALLSGWGTAAVHAPTQLTTWVDTGPGRARQTVALQAPLTDGVTADIWWAIDVVGGFWTAPIKPSR